MQATSKVQKSDNAKSRVGRENLGSLGNGARDVNDNFTWNGNEMEMKTILWR